MPRRDTPTGFVPVKHRRPRLRRLLTAIVLVVLMWRGVVAVAPRGSIAGDTSASMQPPTSLFAFTRASDGLPIRWAGCAPIRYAIRVDDRGEPSVPADVVRRVLAQVEAVSNFRFFDAGTVVGLPLVGSAETGAQRLVRADIDLWIGGATEDDWPALKGHTAGEAGALEFERAATYLRVRTAFAIVEWNRIEPSPDSQVEQVLQHEIAHALGLAHVDSPTEQMAPQAIHGLVGYGPGDREGLRQASEEMRCP